ncbi:D-ribose pyranase [Aminipila luticellarii]|uniref:D-ribose pyranase n=1 Tax=Aminipila luticellarii TaxID=2507160 RepID=A0A410PWX0_9FIRM|nr:D-ribose pyranase [Aminipila luticellarii]QAT43366.1 D-ribose pyranase [Aminipila luticellarii]
MKKTSLLHSEISYCISKLGHKDRLLIGDAGLPVPDGVKRIDLAVSEGIPSFMSVLGAVLSEQKVEKVILAEEIKTASRELHNEILSLLRQSESRLEVEYMPHEEFKKNTETCKCAIRTGEFTSFANIILISGVVF